MTLQWIETPDGDVLDPCTDFRLNAMQRFFAEGFLEEAWWIAEFELRKTSIDSFVEGIGSLVDGGIVVPKVYDRETRAAEHDFQWVTLYARTAALVEANRRDGDETTNKLGVSRLFLGTTVPEQVVDFEPVKDRSRRPIDVPEGTVLMAVIDNGIAFAHNLFRRAVPIRSRVAFAWIMDAAPPALGSPVSQGRELGRGEIEALLAANMHAGLLDEDGFYRAAGLIDFARPGHKPAAQRRSHGTHVMGLAAGNGAGPDDGKRPILCVDLPTEVTMDVSGGSILPSLGLALDWIRQRAARFRINGQPGKFPPVVVNFSYGNFGGPHDGTGLVEQMLDSRLGATGQNAFVGVLPAGNGNLARIHAEIAFCDKDEDDGEPVELDWRIQPDDRSASYVQLWMPYRRRLSDLVEVTVTPPGGPPSNPVTTRPGSSQDLVSDAGGRIDVVGRVSFTFVPAPTARGRITICVVPTASLKAVTGLAPAGVWKISIRNMSLEPHEHIHAWIQRDETLPGFPDLGRQSYFDDPDYQRFDRYGAPMPTDPPENESNVLRAGTLSGFACGALPLVIAGLDVASGRLADYSAAGPITPPRNLTAATRAGPDASARSDDSPVLQGVLSAGSRSGSIVAMNGTSVAAPQVARRAADVLSAGGAVDRQWVGNLANQEDARFPPPKPAETRTGGGRLDLSFRIGSDRQGE